MLFPTNPTRTFQPEPFPRPHYRGYHPQTLVESKPAAAPLSPASGFSFQGLHPIHFTSQLPPTPAIPRRTKMIATLGPASNSPAMIKKLIEAGVDIFRLNFSHGTQDQHGANIETIRTQASALNKPVMILADMQGPKIRVGELPNGAIELALGQEVKLVRQGASTEAGVIPTTYPAMIDDIDPSDAKNRILLDDGKLELRPLRKENDTVICEVVRGGTLSSRKGINLPGVKVSAPSLSDKDISDMTYALAKGVDILAISFVRRDEDVRQARQLMQRLGKDIPLIAKIEKPEAVEEKNLTAIIKEADGVMVARGDLGVEVDITLLARMQKAIIRQANTLSKPVIVATQMLESMMNSTQPSRSDVTDIANAVEDGADILMLSGETSVGKYPVETVKMMASIIEKSEAPTPLTQSPTDAGQPPIWVTLSNVFKRLLKSKQVQGIAAYVDVSTVRRALPTPIDPSWKVIAFTHNEKLFKQLSMVKGMQPIKIDPPQGNALTPEAQRTLLKGLIQQKQLGNTADEAKPWVLLGETPDSRSPWFLVE